MICRRFVETGYYVCSNGKEIGCVKSITSFGVCISSPGMHQFQLIGLS